MLDAVPGRTATELATDAGAAAPELAGELSRAAIAFNDVTYGERPGTEAAYRMIADLDGHLRSRGPARPAASAAPAPAERLDIGAMTSTATAVEPTASQRWRTGRWVVLAIVVIGVVGTVSTLLTAPRPGGRMDPDRNVFRGCPRPRQPASRPWRRRSGRRRHRRCRTRGEARFVGADGTDPTSCRRRCAAPAGRGARRPSGGGTDIADKGDPRAASASIGGGNAGRPARLRSAGSRARRRRAIRRQRHFRGGGRCAADEVLRGRSSPLQQRRPHRHGRGQRRLHGQRRSAEAG